ncbi:hypothetical protein ACOSP6_15465 [Tenacibaculum sp. MEBiC06402]|uniref:hypothetical protein n=1 Tax=unclassified Tenacibaculum TaxID=2635139 RepID=UPI003B99096F
MKKLLFLLSTIILLSCSQKVSKEDLEGVWWNLEKTGDFEIILKRDSISINNGIGITLNGTFKLEKDSILLSINNKSHKEYFKYEPKDSTLTFNKSKYFKSPLSVVGIDKNFNFINIQSRSTIHSDSLNINSSIFKAIRNEKNELQVVLNGKTATIEDIPLFLNSTTCSGGKPVHYRPYLILGQNLTTKDLSKIFPYLDAMNHYVITLVTQYDFPNRLFHFYDIRIELFKEQLVKNGPPPRESDISRKDYLAKYNPEIITIKSKQDFKKLNAVKPNSHYLVSIDLDLPIENYLHLTQKLNSIRKNKKTRIRTELINF